MSELDQVKQAIDKARGELNAAAGVAGQAQSAVSEKAQQFMGLGVTALAQLLVSAAEALGAAAATVGQGHAATDETVRSLAGLTDAVGLNEMQAKMGAAVEKLGEAASFASKGHNSAAEAMLACQQTEVEPAMQACNSAVGQIEVAQAAVNDAATKTGEYRQRVDQIAKAGN